MNAFQRSASRPNRLRSARVSSARTKALSSTNSLTVRPAVSAAVGASSSPQGKPEVELGGACGWFGHDRPQSLGMRISISRLPDNVTTMMHRHVETGQLLAVAVGRRWGRREVPLSRTPPTVVRKA